MSTDYPNLPAALVERVRVVDGILAQLHAESATLRDALKDRTEEIRAFLREKEELVRALEGAVVRDEAPPVIEAEDLARIRERRRRRREGS